MSTPGWRGALMVCGTSSDAGKTTVVTGLCRLLARRGVAVAPFKAQNMSLNSAVTPAGHEIGRAQAAQAQAAGIEPDVAMNPILLKPTSDRSSQVVLAGRPWATLDAAEYHRRKPELQELVLSSLTELRGRHDVVLCEGAGSPAELNLLDHDLVNLGLARRAGLAALVVGDIERGGVFAALYGTVALLPDELRACVGGFIINKFRGDPGLLGQGPAELQRRCGVPTVGVLPWVRAPAIDAEDSLALRALMVAGTAARSEGGLDVAVVRFPRISNFTDLEPLALEGQVSIRLVEHPRELGRPDLLVLPGSKATVSDLAWLRETGLATAVVALAADAGSPSTTIVGICGGQQMLGRHIHDEIEACSTSVIEGLGLLPTATVFATDKVTRRRRGHAFGTAVQGYEIHHGRTAAAVPWITLEDGEPEGNVSFGGRVLGTGLHGLWEGDAFRSTFLASVAARVGKRWTPSGVSFAALREERFDALADLLEAHLDLPAIERLVARAGRPSVSKGVCMPDIDRHLSAVTAATSRLIADVERLDDEVAADRQSEGFPFSAVVGQDDAKLALLLAGVEARLGGVLLRGDKGAAKTTLARGLAALLPGSAPFVELPVGATEDRVVGTLDLARALTGGEVRFQPGLLAAAHGGVLYVDEVNLLPDHLVDVLLDVAASGVNRVEREGVSHAHPSRFLLVGSMNPEEGDLRPQLLDRFGLAVEVRASMVPAERAEAVRRRLAWEVGRGRDAGGPAGEWTAADAELSRRLAAAEPAALPDALVDAVAALCAALQAEGLRADLTICRAAAALAGWEGRIEAGPADVRRVAAMALAHRARRDPLDPAGLDPQRLSDALDEQLGRDDDEAESGGERPSPGSPTRDGGDDGGDDGAAPEREEPAALPATDPQARGVVPGSRGSDSSWAAPGRRAPAAAPGRRAPAVAPAGRLVGARVPEGPLASVAVGATVRAAAARRSAAAPDGAAPATPVGAGDLREAVRIRPAANLVVIAVDASGSMGAEQRMTAAKGAVLGLLLDAYQRRDLVALVAFRGEGADVLLRPTGSVEVARARLAELPTGGRTPLAAGIATAAAVAVGGGRSATHRPVLVVVTDGRATSGPGATDPVEAAEAAAAAVRRQAIASVVVDVERAEGGRTAPLGLAVRLARLMGAEHVPLRELTAGALRAAVATGLGTAAGASRP